MIKNSQFSFQKVTKHFSQAKFDYKETRNQYEMFHRNCGLNSLKNRKFYHFFSGCFYGQERLIFFIQNVIKHLIQAKFALKGMMKKFQIFHQNHGLTSLEKGNFATFLNRCFYSKKMKFFYRERHLTLFLGQICLKRTDKEISNFSSKPQTNPFEKCKFCHFFKTMFHGQKWLVFYMERHKTLCLSQMCLRK